jgi:hypothetical protein
MNNLKTTKHSLKRALLFVFIACFVWMPITKGLFYDLEQSSENSIVSGILDISTGFGSQNGDTFSHNLNLLSDAQDTMTISSFGNIPLSYKTFYQYKSGDTAVCDSIRMTIQKDGSEKYSGILSLFSDYQTNITDHDTDLMFAGMESHGFDVTFGLVGDIDPLLEGGFCGFELVTVAWQSEYEGEGMGFWDSEVLTGTLTIVPAPQPEIEGEGDTDLLSQDTSSLQSIEDEAVVTDAIVGEEDE